MILYIHGFNSSSGSSKAQQLRAWLTAQGRENEFACPDLPHQPSRAVALLEAILASSPDPVRLIGSSLGGFYATVLVARHPSVKAALINPAVHPQLLLRDALGPNKNYYTEETYDFTQSHLDALASFDLPQPRHAENLLLLLETGDSVLDYRDAVNYYRNCHQIIFQGGDHGFTRFVDLLSCIDRF
ncbi:MAG TPA: YqiA/YcfP family alpha/beta fold hydrolase [Thiobacillaceae bacterium]|nr:YqiA/YcfP family alpha/beta fold hydrolase [Thiobacillaceae bacterium]